MFMNAYARIDARVARIIWVSLVSLASDSRDSLLSDAAIIKSFIEFLANQAYSLPFSARTTKRTTS
jgi:hypothetical protein